MRHRKKGRQLGRQTKHRWALFRSLVTSLLEHERIETTETKAKEIRGFTDRMITLGKEGTLPARRQALAFIRSKDVVSKLFSDVAVRFQRPSRWLYEDGEDETAGRRCREACRDRTRHAAGYCACKETNTNYINSREPRYRLGLLSTGASCGCDAAVSIRRFSHLVHSISTE